jgi:putative flavoprotein involved in K+ transport
VDAVDVIVVGAGQAGLALSHELSVRGVTHAVLERGRVGQAWRDRWDSFCLVTPNWTIQLPGGAYDGNDPDGYLPRDEIVGFFERYAARIDAPVREGVEVTALAPDPAAGFRVVTSAGELRARRVALASGAYQRPHRPGAETLPSSLAVLDVHGYRRPADLPEGGVLVVGSGQSGLQIAEELQLAGRDVVLACGRAAWAPRRIGDHDVVWWASESGYLDQPVEALPDPAMRLWANLQNSGKDGGHDLNYRTLRAQGVTLVGRFLGAAGGELRFAPDLAESVAFGDEGYRTFLGLLQGFAAERGIAAPDAPPPPPFDASAAPAVLPASRFSTVIYAGGFRPAYGGLVPIPEAFDDLGFPIHVDGESVAVPGLHFIGVHFLRKRKSSLLIGVGEDAAIVAGRMARAA